jgi:glycosyltransferase involved in cell wall biosynthesis
VAHLHEALIDDPYAPLLSRCTLQFIRRRLKRANAVIVPDLHRGRSLRRHANLARTPFVVMNCPRRLQRIPRSRLHDRLAEYGVRPGKIVHYQGNIAPRKYLENVIRSMKAWPSDAVFVMAGGGSSEFIDVLKKVAAETGVLSRIVFLGRLSYADVMASAAGADVGLTLLNTDYPNWRWAAGASNKRFEYIALGIPQVTNHGPGVERLFTRKGVATAVDPSEPAAIAASVNEYLRNREWSASIGDVARRLHLAEFNYEHQFQPFVSWIRDQVRARDESRR